MNWLEAKSRSRNRLQRDSNARSWFHR